MSAVPSHPPFLTVEEYFRLEAESDERHEYWDGQIVMNQGGTYRHSQVIANAIVALATRLRKTPCIATDSNTRVALHSRRKYAYPDVTVVCGEPQYDPADSKPTTVLNPTLVVEVLSEGTEAHDRGRKFTAYRGIASLRQYVLISTDSPRVETFFREDDAVGGTWVFAAVEGLDRTIRLDAIRLELPLAELYERVTFDGDNA